MSKIKILLVTNLLCSLSIYAQFKEYSGTENLEEFKSSFQATIKVPLNYEVGNKDSIALFVRKFPSLKNREGSIWLIPGGPGESGTSLYPLVAQFAKIFPHLDILIPDHRGTGLSSKICPNEEGVDSPGGMALANDEWGSCFNHMYSNPSYVQAFSITNAANDLSVLINGFGGGGKQYIYGVSYGTQLVLRLLQLNLVHLDGVILDSLVPLQDNEIYDLSHRSFVIDDVGRSVLAFYDKQKKREVSLTSQLQAILQRARTNEDYAKKLPAQGLSSFLGTLLDLPKIRNRMPKIIEALSVDNFSPLNEAIADVSKFYNAYAGKYKNATTSIPLVQVISSSENNMRPDLKKSELVLEAEKLLFTSPLPLYLAENTMPTYKRDSYFAKIPDQMPPTLILQGTLDPKTHVVGATQHAEVLSKNNNSITYVQIKDAPHFIALFAPDSFVSITSKFMNKEKIENKEVHDKGTQLK